MNNSKLPPLSIQSLASDVRPVSVYRLLIIVLTALILLTGVSIVLQTQERHHTYQRLQALKKEYNVLAKDTERLLIEQQTFGSTAQIVNVSADELGMFYPAKQQRQIITLTEATSSQTGELQP